MKKSIAFLLCLSMLLTGCSKANTTGSTQGTTGSIVSKPQENITDLGGDKITFGDDIGALGAYDGYFDEETRDINVKCVSGTEGAYKIDGATLTFTDISEDSVYSISGKFSGNVVIDVGNEYKFELELEGFSLVSKSTNPITVKSGEKVSVNAKENTKNYIYDKREAADYSYSTIYDYAIHSEVDLEIGGNGNCVIVSENNNGIHTKNDLKVKNINLFIYCMYNALKGNDGVEIESGNTTLISALGNCIETSDSNISKNGDQLGDVSITGGTHALYSACDGINAAHNVTVNGDDTVLNIYTDKYSNYSKEIVQAPSNDYYIRFTSNEYAFSIKYYNSDEDYRWVDAKYHSMVQGEKDNFYYFSFPKNEAYDRMQVYIYTHDMEQGQDKEYVVASKYIECNKTYDTFVLVNQDNKYSYSWTKYTTNIPEAGGNIDKRDYSTKGIAAANEIIINAGIVNIKAYDDSINANNETPLENGKTPLGNVTINGGTLTLYSKDEGIYADGALNITAGNVYITNSYDGVGAASAEISGGYVSVQANNDGINSTATEGEGIKISGGTIYINCDGIGLASNSDTSYKGVVFSGGNIVIISDSSGSSAINTKRGYTYESGKVLAIMPRGEMRDEIVYCENFESIGKYKETAISQNSFLNVKFKDSSVVVRMPISVMALIITLGDNSPDIKIGYSNDVALDCNGIAWN